MIKQISILILLFIISLNVVSCETYTEYWNTSSEISEEYYGRSTNGNTNSGGTFKNFILDNVAYFQGLKKFAIEGNNSGFTITNDFYWTDVTYQIGTDILGNGTAGYNKGATKTFLIYFIDEPLDFSDYSGRQLLIINNAWPDSYIHNKKCCYPCNPLHPYHMDAVVYESSHWSPITPITGGYKYDYITIKDFKNIITASKINNELWNINITRNNSNMAKYDIIGNVTNYYHEDVLEDFIFDTNIIEKPINVSGTNIYDEYFQHTFFIDDEDDDTPTLTTDKTYYNTSETINISYTNIDKIYEECTSSFCNEPYQLWIYAITHTENIPKFRQWLYSDRRDESFILNTSILSPQTEYKLIITSGESNIMIESDIFYVYPDDEYLSLSCETPCSTVNNGNIIIYYKINNNSNIIIKDNNNNIINQYYGIINEGEIIYTIPGDIEHLNTYPNWKIYLNNTDYSTSFNKDLTVYWSLFIEPTETPTISPTETPDINISDQLDNLSTEVKPLKELLFGLVYIVVDNPDYNTDNIISENEINNWLNSIIPLCLFLCLIILYIGLHKKRE